MEKQPADGKIHGSEKLNSKAQRRKVKEALKKQQEPEPKYYTGKQWWD